MQNALHFVDMLTMWHFMLSAWVLAVSLVFFGTYRALLKLKKPGSPRPLLPDAALPPISILKPIKGLDRGLEENVESFFRSEYPVFELLFSVADSGDPAIALLLKLIHKYPGVRARLFIGESQVGLNPKINNIYRSYQEASYDTILISDSNTRVEPDYLRRLASQFGPDVAMQSSVVHGAHPIGLGGALEATFLNTYYARSMIMVEALGHPCVIGKSMMFRRRILEKESGWPAISDYIAEDYEAGHRLHMAGYKVQTTQDPIEQYIGEYSVRDFWSRHVRWGRIRKLQAPLPFCIEFLIGAIASGLLGAAAFSHLYHVPFAIFFVLHMSCWFLCDSLMLARIGHRPGPATFPVWLLRELLHLPLWVHISMGNSIQWRGKRIRLKRGGIVKLDPGKSGIIDGSAEEWSRA